MAFSQFTAWFIPTSAEPGETVHIAIVIKNLDTVDIVIAPRATENDISFSLLDSNSVNAVTVAPGDDHEWEGSFVMPESGNVTVIITSTVNGGTDAQVTGIVSTRGGWVLVTQLFEDFSLVPPETPEPTNWINILTLQNFSLVLLIEPLPEGWVEILSITGLKKLKAPSNLPFWVWPLVGVGSIIILTAVIMKKQRA